jgi:hypothetical protein
MPILRQPWICSRYSNPVEVVGAIILVVWTYANPGTTTYISSRVGVYALWCLIIRQWSNGGMNELDEETSDEGHLQVKGHLNLVRSAIGPTLVSF